MSQNPNYNPYNPNPSDPNQIPGTSYGAPPPPPPPGQGSNPNYNPYPGNPPTPGPGAPPPPNTNYDPYNPYQADPTVRDSSGPGSNPNYYPYGSNDPTVMSSSPNPNYAPYQQQVPPVPIAPPGPSGPPKRRTGRILAIVGGVLVLLIIAAIIIAVAANNNATTSHVNATQTAVKGTAQANTAATASTNATANANATAGAVATATAAAALVNPYAPGGGTLAINDPLTDNSQGNNWFDDGKSCTFTGGAYQVAISQTGFVQDCLTQAKHFSDFAYQVQMTVTKGDGGGVIFRADDPNNNYYYFQIDVSGNYELDNFNSSGGHKISGGTSSAIKTQVNQPNVIGIVAQGNTIDAYVNMQHVATFHDSKLVQGRVGVAAEDASNSTTVSFNDLKVWIL